MYAICAIEVNGDVRSLLISWVFCFRLGQEGITVRLRKAAFGSTIRMHMAFFDTPEILGFDPGVLVV